MVKLTVEAVAPEFRWLAKAVAYITHGGLALYLVVSLALIFVRRHDPPTVMSMVDGEFQKAGDTHYPWGEMPYIIIFLYRNHTFSQALVCGVCTGSTPDWSSGFFNIGGAVPTIAQNDWQLIVNSTMLSPNFGDIYAYGDGFAFKEKPELSVMLEWGITTPNPQMQGFYQVVLADASTPEDLMQPPLSKTGTRAHLDWEEYMKFDVADATMVGLQEFVLTKQVVPKSGVFWGFPWQGEHTKAIWKLEASSYMHPFVEKAGTFYSAMPGPVSIIQFKVSESAYMKLKPVGIIAQVCMVFGKIGGFLALSSAIFFFAFVRRYPKSAQSLQDMALTLRGHAEDHSPIESTEQAKDLKHKLLDA